MFVSLTSAGSAGDLESVELTASWASRARIGRWSAKDIRAATEACMGELGGVETLTRASDAWVRLRRGLERFLTRLPRIKAGSGSLPADRKGRARAMRLSRDGQQGKAAQALTSSFFSAEKALEFAVKDLRADQPEGPAVAASGPAGEVPTEDAILTTMHELREAAETAPRHRGAGPSGLLPDALHDALRDSVLFTRALAQFALLGARWGPPAWLAAAEGAVILTNGKPRLISSPEALFKLLERWQSRRLRAQLRGLVHAGGPFRAGSASALGAMVQCLAGQGQHVIVGDGRAAYNTVHHSALVDAAPAGTFGTWLAGALQRRAVALRTVPLAVPRGRGAGLGGPLMVAAYSLAMERVAAAVALRFPGVFIQGAKVT